MRILVADDQPLFRRLIEAALRTAGHQVVLVADGREAWETLESGEFDLAVLDWMMPEVDGPTLCRRIREKARPRYVYLILLTAKDQLEDVISGLDAGADEYLVKPFNPEELRARVRAGGRIIELERQLSQANLHLETLASTDGLTGLLNRRAVLAHLEREAARCTKDRACLSIVMLDLDGFKEANDQHGHAAGDMLLREVAERLQAVLRRYDHLGRLGGDEFLMVLPGLSEMEAGAIAERMRRTLTAGPCLVGRGAAVEISASFGVAGVEAGAQVDDALVLADQALYQAKREGGNRIAVASALPAEKELTTSPH